MMATCSISPVMVIADGTVYRFIADHLGSVRLVVNAETGEVVQRMVYDAFGRVLQDSSPGFQPFGFAGGLYDDDTGHVRFGTRDYDAYAGRWTATDPILFGGGQGNLYGYIANDPVNRFDPLGLYTVSVGFGGTAAVVGFGASFFFSGTYAWGDGPIESGFNITVGWGAAASVAAYSGGVYGQCTNARKLRKLEGPGEYLGRSSVGPAYIGGVGGEGYEGMEVAVGRGGGFQLTGAGQSHTWIFWDGPWK